MGVDAHVQDAPKIGSRQGNAATNDPDKRVPELILFKKPQPNRRKMLGKIGLANMKGQILFRLHPFLNAFFGVPEPVLSNQANL